MGNVSRTTYLACQITRLSGCENYSLLRISDAMTVTNGLLDTGVDTSSEAADG
jgi:hypothetical protein